MNNQTKTQENVKKALAKQTLGLPLTPHEHALVTLYGQSPVQQKENKPEFVEKYLKPLVVALGVGVVNVVYRKNRRTRRNRNAYLRKRFYHRQGRFGGLAFRLNVRHDKRTLRGVGYEKHCNKTCYL